MKLANLLIEGIPWNGKDPTKAPIIGTLLTKKIGPFKAGKYNVVQIVDIGEKGKIYIVDKWYKPGVPQLIPSDLVAKYTPTKNEMKLSEIILKEAKKTTLQNLKFGVNVQKGDHLPTPNSDSLRRINNEQDLQSYLEDKDLSLEVIIDRSQPWSSIFIIPAFQKGRQDYIKGKGDYLNKLRQSGTRSGLD